MASHGSVADFPEPAFATAVRAKHRKGGRALVEAQAEIAKVLLREHFINNFKHIEDSKRGVPAHLPQVQRRRRQRHLRHPARQHAGPARVRGQVEDPADHGRLGTAVLSTSRGLMTDREAREAGLGGEIVFQVWWGAAMSRYRQASVPIPSGVTVAVDGNVVSVKGPKGELGHPCCGARWSRSRATSCA